MEVRYSKHFLKQYYKLPVKLQVKFKTRQQLLLKNPASPQLRLHPLSGKYKGYHSINVTGDIRALFQYEGDSIIFFGYIGTHSQLYG